MVKLNRQRVFRTTVRDGKRDLVLIVGPGDYIGLRPVRTRKVYDTSLSQVYLNAVRADVARRKEEKRKASGKKFLRGPAKVWT